MTYGVYIRQLAATFRDAPANDVEDRDIYVMLDKKADKPAAANMLLKVAGLFFGWAKKRGYIRNDPTTGVEPLNYKAGEHEPWPDDLLEKALNDPKVQLPVALLYFLGQRIGDTCQMPRTAIKAGRVKVKQEKTDEEVEIRIHSRLAQIIAASKVVGITTILTGPGGRPAKEATIRDRIQRWAAKRGHHVVPHGLRKNAVNTLLDVGCSVGQVSSITGQSLQMVTHYAKKRNKTKMAGDAITLWEQNG